MPGKKISDLDVYDDVNTDKSRRDLLEISKNTGTYGSPTYATNGSRKITIEQLKETLFIKDINSYNQVTTGSPTFDKQAYNGIANAGTYTLPTSVGSYEVLAIILEAELNVTVNGLGTGISDLVFTKQNETAYLIDTVYGWYPLAVNKEVNSSAFELLANKENTTLDISSTKYPTNNLVKTYVDNLGNTLTSGLATKLTIANNLSDLTNTTQARDNLLLGATNDVTHNSITLSNTTVSTLPFIDSAKKIISATGALLGTWFQTLTADTNPVDADTIIVNDSTASFEAKKTTLLQLWTNYLLGKVQALGYLSGSGLTTNTIPRANSGALQDSYITEITTNAGGSVGATRPYPLVATDPIGTGSFSGYLKWVDNGFNIARLFIYKPYTNGQGAGWYQILDTQNPSFPALATSSPAFGMGLSTMTNSISTAPTNLYTGEIRNLRVGSQLYGLGVFQAGAGFHYLKPFGGNHWEFTVAVNSYMRDWDWEVIGSTANSGKGGGSNTLSNLSKIGNSTVKFRAMANTNSPYYYIEGVFKVDLSGAITSLIITQPSSNTTAFNVSITDTRIQFTGNAFSQAYVICEKIAGQYWGALYTTPYENERYSADATVKYWAGGGGFALGSATINARSQLHLQSTSKGFLPNVLTTAQRDAVSWVAGDAGMIIYNSTTNKHQGWNGTTWNDMY